MTAAVAPDHPHEPPRRFLVSAADEGRSVAELLGAVWGLDAGEVRRLVLAGRIRLDGRGASPGRRVRAGQVLAVLPSGIPEPSGPAPVALALDVVHEDAALLVVNKPAGTLVHPVSAGARDTLANGVAWHLRRAGGRVHPVHRLDRETSGLVLFAKSAALHRVLERQLHSRELRRGYLALVHGRVAKEAGSIDAPVGRSRDDPPLRAVVPEGQPALTRFRVGERFASATLLRLELETGRTHQIRVHLAHAGHPVLGDRWYGRRGLELIARQALHAGRLALRHPTSGEPLELAAPLPADMAALAARLREGTAG